MNSCGPTAFVRSQTNAPAAEQLAQGHAAVHRMIQVFDGERVISRSIRLIHRKQARESVPSFWCALEGDSRGCVAASNSRDDAEASTQASKPTADWRCIVAACPTTAARHIVRRGMTVMASPLCDATRVSCQRTWEDSQPLASSLRPAPRRAARPNLLAWCCPSHPPTRSA